MSCLAVLFSMAVFPSEARADGEQFVMLDLVVYFNDSTTGCYDKVIGEQLKITGTGTYTMTFDCAKALQLEQKNAGVTGLNNIGAIYLIDDQVLNMVTLDSIVNSFDITYDSLKIDGTEVELSNHDERTGMKSRGEIDTNGPINAWEDCQLADGTYTIGEDFALNFTGFENPQVLELTFTVTNMEFKEAATEPAADTTEASSEEETTEASSEETTEAASEQTTEAESSEPAEENNIKENNTRKIVLVVVLVIVLLAVIILVVKKLKK